MKKEIVKLQRIEPLTDYEKHFCKYDPKLHKVGWVTWADKENFADAVRLSKNGNNKCLHPENNRYQINFDVTKFKVI